MTRWRTACLCASALLLVLGGVNEARGQMFVTTGRATLRGLPGVEVMVEDLQPELKDGGLSATALRTDVEGWLRTGGVTVYPSQAANPSPAKAYLYVHVNALPLPGGAYAIAVQLHLRQTVHSLATDANIVDAMTWDMHNVVAVAAGRLQEVSAEVRIYVGSFIEDWVAVH